MERIAILGSTGSIGTQTLELMSLHKDRYDVAVLAAHSNWQLLLEQAKKFRPEYVFLENGNAALKIKDELPEGVKLYEGKMEELCSLDSVDTVLIAVVGIAGLPAVLESIKNNKKIALANKEALVTGGALVKQALAEKGAKIYPVDSEHSAIYQCIGDHKGSDIRRIFLTASGGPFRLWTAVDMENATVEQALAHPNWSMGKKISVDSASMMNKALEVIEAYWLFGVEHERIEVLIHPQSIVHSAVEFTDGCVMAQMGVPDMKMPIMYALSGPERVDTMSGRLELAEISQLTFEKPDHSKFPCLGLAYEALKKGKTASVVLNAANEIAVNAFLNRQYPFGRIYDIVSHMLSSETLIDNPTIEDIYYTDKETRVHTLEYIASMKGR